MQPFTTIPMKTKQKKDQTSPLKDSIEKSPSTANLVNGVAKRDRLSEKEKQGPRNIPHWFKQPEIDARDQKILIPYQNLLYILRGKQLRSEAKKQLRKWIVDLYETTLSDAFIKFNRDQLTEGQMKAYSAKNILFNVQQLIQKVKPNTSQDCRNSIIQFINSESKKVIGEVILKYPQSSGRGASRKLKKAFYRPDNRQSDEFDLFKRRKGQSTPTFFYREDGNYILEIMKALNHVMSTASNPLDPQNDSLTLFESFKLLMESLFQTHDGSMTASNSFENIYLPKVYEHVIDQNITKAEVFESIFYSEPNESTGEYWKLAAGTLKRENTTFKIHQKIPSGAKIFSQYDINAGVFNTPDSSVLRIMTKWAGQLRLKLHMARQLIQKRVQLFKTIDEEGKLVQISPLGRMFLFKAACSEQARVSDSFKYLQHECELMEEQLAADYNEGMYCNDSDTNVGIFAARANSCVGRYLLIYINELIHSLAKIPQRAVEEYLEKTQYKDQTCRNLATLDLITFKTGDLMRAKFKSEQKNVIDLLKALQKFSDKCPSVFRLVRIKDRLEEMNNDILVNFFFMDRVMCELQISVTVEVNKKEQSYNVFNHFIYQLKRAEFGVLAECACILAHYDPVVKNYSQRQDLAPDLQVDRLKNKKLGVEQNKKTKNDGLQRREERMAKFKTQNNVQSMNQNNYYYKEIQKLERKAVPFFCSFCGNFKKNHNPYFFRNRLHEVNCYECNKCYQSRMMETQQSRRELIAQLFLTRPPQEIQTITEHFEFFNYTSFETASQFLSIKSGFIIAKNTQHPMPQYFEVAQFQQEIYFVSASDGQPSIRVLFHENKEAPAKSLVQKLKQAFILTPIEKKVCKIEKFTPEQTLLGIMELGLVDKVEQKKEYLRLTCKCCQLNQLYLGLFFNCLIGVIINRSYEVLKDVRKKQKQVLYLGQRNLKEDVRVESKMPYVKRFYIFQNQLKDINCMKMMENLLIADISTNLLVSLPDLQYNQKLQSLNCSYNQITSLEKLKFCPYLLTLKCESNRLKSLEGVQNCFRLELLYCHQNFIGTLKALRKLKSIKILWCLNNELKSLEGLESSSSLQQICCENNQLADLSPLSSCKELKLISCAKNTIHTFEHLSNISNLNWLICPSNHLTNLKGLERSFKLVTIQCFDNRLESLQGIQNCSSLIQLKCGNNSKLKSLEPLKNCLKLTEFEGVECSIESLKPFENCAMLAVLCCSTNQITSLEGLQKCSQLQVLICANNQIKSLEPIKNCYKLRTLEAINNPLQPNAQEVINSLAWLLNISMNELKTQ